MGTRATQEAASGTISVWTGGISAAAGSFSPHAVGAPHHIRGAVGTAGLFVLTEEEVEMQLKGPDLKAEKPAKA